MQSHSLLQLQFLCFVFMIYPLDQSGWFFTPSF
ncbi:hypothetical protein NC651_013035 [Populus alba x Populus x berolinensis]|nr:hypothetical protein NC651_013035 [Populus alba x Populus x berolinensis]